MLRVSLGDLNNDGIKDVAMVIQDNNSVNFIKNNSGELMNTNPRILVVLFGKKDGSYSLALENHILIPRYDNFEYDDYFDGVLNSGIIISKGVLKVSLGVFSFNSSEMKIIQFTMRWQNQRFELIGYDYNNTHRSGETRDVSINLSTHRAKITCGNIESDLGKVTWQKISDKVWSLDMIDNVLNFNPGINYKSCEDNYE